MDEHTLKKRKYGVLELAKKLGIPEDEDIIQMQPSKDDDQKLVIITQVRTNGGLLARLIP